MECLVLGVKSYNFENDKGEKIEGNKVFYMTFDSVDGINGYAPMTVNIEKNVFTEFPAVYKMDFGFKQGRNNKPEVVLKGAELLERVSILSESGQVLLGE